MSLNHFKENMLPEIEGELKRQVARLDQPHTREYFDMITYHMGWSGEAAGPQASGKRIRPMLLLLTTAACGSDWKAALPAAAAVELVHNFSLVHDDVQDNSDKRRGRRTVWNIWGVPMAINVGDGLFVLSNQAMMDLAQSHPASTVMRAASLLHDTCLDLTRGQYMDMAYEEKPGLTVEDYWPMISGKTSALLSACTHIGALLAGAGDPERENLRQFGHHLGLAFQIQDDILGIWGDESVTGKSAASDLVERKKSLPVLYGLERRGEFAEIWTSGLLQAAEVHKAAACLEREGARQFAEERAGLETNKALEHLHAGNLHGQAGEALIELVDRLLRRNQ
jgi:geranylgeranyl diphosphate synthase type I